MKANPLACVLLVLLAVAVRLPAKQPVTSSGTNATDAKIKAWLNEAEQQPVPSNNTNAAATTKSRPLTDAEVGLVPDNPIEALKASAEKGNAAAQFLLGWKYDNGEGVVTNYTEAAKWYHKAAEQGMEGAQFDLAIMYDNGYGVPKDRSEAAKWFRKAAEQGNASAQSRLGMMYLTAEGVERNYSEAFKLFSKAANQGDESGLKGLSDCYEGGYGTPIDYVKAVKITRRFAEAGDNDEQRNLGLNYEQGHGVSQDYVEAYKWYNLSAANEDVSLSEALEKQGMEPASKMRDHLAQLMTPEQIAEAQQLSRAFKLRKESGSDNSSTSPDNPTATGTGFFITDDGYLISNYHVVKDAAQVRLLTRAGTIPAKVVQVDGANDIALLKAEGKFSPLPIAASRTVRLGNTVATVGFPDIGLQGFAPKLAKGEIASLSGAQDDPRHFQISVPVQPGNSGGALVDERGNVVGIVSAKLSARVALAESGALPENVNYAVKSSFLLGFLESVPDVSAKLKAPVTVDRKFEDVVKSAQDAAVLVLVY